MEFITIYKCNQSCVARVTKNGNRNKHVEEKYHIFLEIVTSNEVKLTYRPTNVMIAEI